ncbi:unnamed protein product [Eruca vesicaria subsp. sativa]|uniref:Uncharacterized protein n=1 Tax=Eruca vesicaria subsp. sativa TaxID=29727 RepID=A0ABC8L0L8_ERUVS|nr:unnamed protein product [Eruca vesicaria subsp. sativa]
MDHRYPVWVNEEPDTDLDNLIVDILNGQLNERFWDGLACTEGVKIKYQARASAVPDTVDESPSTKRKKDKQPIDGSEASEMSIKGLTTKIESIDVSVADVSDKVIKAIEATIDARVDARVEVQQAELKKNNARFEEEVTFLKTKVVASPHVNISAGVANSKAYEDDGGSSNELSWILQKKIGSKDRLPMQCVVKKEKIDKKTIKKDDLKNKEVKKKGRTTQIPLKKVKLEKAFEIPQLNDESISTAGLERTQMWEKSVQSRAVLDKLAATFLDPSQKRKTQLTQTQTEV